MQVYGLYYEDIDWTLVCLFKNYPTIEDLRKVHTSEFFKPDDQYLTNILEGNESFWDLRPVNVIQNGEV
jgi:hypothetical protein